MTNEREPMNPIREVLKAANIVLGPGGARAVTHEAVLRLMADSLSDEPEN